MVTHRKALLSLMDKIYVMDGTSLRDVDDLGGLDAYLQKITDTEAAVPSPAKDEFAEDQRRTSQQKADRLAAENLRLQQNLHSIEQKPRDNVGPDGTIYINH